MKKILILFFAFASLFSCNPEKSKEKIYVDKISKNLEDDAFALNSTFQIIEIKINKVQTARLDSFYRELAYERANKLFADLKKNNSNDYTSVERDNKLIELKKSITTADISLKGCYVWYYIKGIYINRSKNQSNILNDSVLAYFDNNYNLLYNRLYFDDWVFSYQ